MASDEIAYRVEPSKSYDKGVTYASWAVRREVATSDRKTESARIANYSSRKTAQAIAAILEALADQEV